MTQEKFPVIGRRYGSYPYTRKRIKTKQATTAQCHSRPRYWSILSTVPPRCASIRTIYSAYVNIIFRQRRSCESQLVVTVHEIANQLAAGHQVNENLLDCSKTFDKVPHGRLHHQFDYYGIREHTVHWFKSFLANRTQDVLLEGIRFTQVYVRLRVLQGTVTGPILFFLYINDLPQMSYTPLVPNCSQTTAFSLKPHY